eukprot:365443-Chlamydomonas_euryale.AAC.1
MMYCLSLATVALQRRMSSLSTTTVWKTCGAGRIAWRMVHCMAHCMAHGAAHCALHGALHGTLHGAWCIAWHIAWRMVQRMAHCMAHGALHGTLHGTWCIAWRMRVFGAVPSAATRFEWPSAVLARILPRHHPAGCRLAALATTLLPPHTAVVMLADLPLWLRTACHTVPPRQPAGR